MNNEKNKKNKEAVVKENYEITIPETVRNKLDLKTGDQIVFKENPNGDLQITRG